MHRVRNVEVREALGQKVVIEIVKEKQRNWKAKLEQMSEDRLEKIHGGIKRKPVTGQTEKRMARQISTGL